METINYAVEIKNLSKNYGGNKAIDNISFNVKHGEIMGFLGPNGAGKSTTMNILPGYLSATSGEVTIKKGYHTGNLYLYPTEEMFKDDNILKPYYALGFVVNSVEADSLVRDKSFQIMAIKVENRFYGNWYHGGRRIVKSDKTADYITDDRYVLTVPQADNSNYILTTEGFNTVTTNKIANQQGSLRLTFLEDGFLKRLINV